MLKSTFISLLKENGFCKKITYQHRGENVIVYSSGKLNCELATGFIFAHSELFTDKNGELIAFHNLKSGYKFYTESVKREIGL